LKRRISQYQIEPLADILLTSPNSNPAVIINHLAVINEEKPTSSGNLIQKRINRIGLPGQAYGYFGQLFLRIGMEWQEEKAIKENRAKQPETCFGNEQVICPVFDHLFIFL
jgi:hypothetical protein